MIHTMSVSEFVLIEIVTLLPQSIYFQSVTLAFLVDFFFFVPTSLFSRQALRVELG